MDNGRTLAVLQTAGSPVTPSQFASGTYRTNHTWASTGEADVIVSALVPTKINGDPDTCVTVEAMTSGEKDLRLVVWKADGTMRYEVRLVWNMRKCAVRQQRRQPGGFAYESSAEGEVREAHQGKPGEVALSF
jgi:hypothetical protein